MNALTFARQEEVKAWEQEFTPCEHTLCLEQEEARQIEPQSAFPCILLSPIFDTRLLTPLGINRSWPLLNVRSQKQPMAMSSVRKSWMWTFAIWGRGG